MTTLTAEDVLGPVQAAVYARLHGDATLRGLLGHRTGQDGVYDDVPESVLHPYIDLGEWVATARNSHDRFGAEVVGTLHVYIKARGFAPGYTIVNRLRALLDEQPLDVDGHTAVAVRITQVQGLKDPNPEIRHLPVQVRITTEQE